MVVVACADETRDHYDDDARFGTKFGASSSFCLGGRARAQNNDRRPFVAKITHNTGELNNNNNNLHERTPDPTGAKSQNNIT